MRFNINERVKVKVLEGEPIGEVCGVVAGGGRDFYRVAIDGEVFELSEGCLEEAPAPDIKSVLICGVEMRTFSVTDRDLTAAHNCAVNNAKFQEKLSPGYISRNIAALVQAQQEIGEASQSEANLSSDVQGR